MKSEVKSGVNALDNVTLWALTLMGTVLKDGMSDMMSQAIAFNNVIL